MNSSAFVDIFGLNLGRDILKQCFIVAFYLRETYGNILDLSV